MNIENIRCSKIGIDGIKKILSKYQLPSPEVESQWVTNGEYDRLFLYNLVYPYGVARKYYLHWIPKEDLIDESILGYQKGLNKYLEEDRNFRIGGYIIWWCQKYCIEKLIKCTWQISNRWEKNNIPKEELDKIIANIKNGKTGQALFLKEHYIYLFDDIDHKYQETGIFLSEEIKDEVLRRSIHKDFSIEELNSEEYEYHRSQLDFEDILILEYSLIYEKEMKK